jgi:RHS repeat-associated protein
VFKYGFNGQEKDDEVYGGGNEYDFGDRVCDSRLGRWFSIDPYFKKYASLSPYSCSANNPIWLQDKNGDSIWVTTMTSESKNANGKTVVKIEHTIHITAKLLDLSGIKKGGGGCSSPKPAVADVAEMTQDYLNNLPKTTITTTSENAPTFITTYKFDASITVAGSMTNVSAQDHLIVAVDDVLGTADPKAPGGIMDAGGVASLYGKIAYVENSSSLSWISESIIHELSHNFGLQHDFTAQNAGNFLSYDKKRTFFTPIQMKEITLNALGHKLNQGTNFEISGKTTNNWFYNTSTNEDPYKKNTKVGEVIPKTIKN